MATTVDARLAWERRFVVPQALLGAAFIVGYSASVLVPNLPAGWLAVITVVLIIAWVAFFVDFIVRLAFTPRGSRLSFVAHNPVDLLSVLFPLFRALRLVTLLQRSRYLSGRTGTRVRARIGVYVVCYAVIFIYFVSLAVLQVEAHAPGATITSFGQAVWWACVTLMTVGYGDTYPVTVLGRIYAVGLMAGGLAIVGSASALVISYITDRVVRPARAVDPDQPDR